MCKHETFFQLLWGYFHKNKDDPLCLHFLGWWEELKTFVLVLSEQTAEKWGALFLSSYFCYQHQH